MPVCNTGDIMAHVKIQPRCKCGKYLADYGRIHADKSPACDCWFKDTSQHGVQSIAPGPFDVYSDSDGHYAVMCGDGKIQHWGIAHRSEERRAGKECRSRWS